jgi:hypothetical protein
MKELYENTLELKGLDKEAYKRKIHEIIDKVFPCGDRDIDGTVHINPETIEQNNLLHLLAIDLYGDIENETNT